MKYYARIGSNEYEIDIDNNNNITIDGKPITVDLRQSGVPELYSVLFGGHSLDMLIEPQRFNYTITFRSEQFQVQVEDERTRKLNTGRKAPAIPHGELAIKAPIPGLVVKVLVAEGDQVEDGQALVLLEAMKMENEIRSIRAGIVREVSVMAGQRVEQ
ncbi:MAG: biotin/lipoyl-containing protein, partial [Caldilineaceae bacterium]